MTAEPSLISIGGADAPVRREIVTPEGVPLHFALAKPGTRAAAFCLDLLFLALGLFLLVLGIFVIGATLQVDKSALHLVGVGIVFFFLAVNFYFPFFEIRWQGATPGKRLLGLRVIDRHGGELSPRAVFARNFMRDLEFWLPLKMAMGGAAGAAGGPAWIGVFFVVWVGAMLFIPLLNRDGLRLGDVIGGTIVVLNPSLRLLSDLTGERASATAKARAPDLVFTNAQLDIYGVKELHVLEELLRRRGRTDPKALRTVCEKIRQKIEWTGAPDEDDRVFLEAFYVAQRKRLEGKMLLGRRKESKLDS